MCLHIGMSEKGNKTFRGDTSAVFLSQNVQSECKRLEFKRQFITIPVKESLNHKKGYFRKHFIIRNVINVYELEEDIKKQFKKSSTSCNARFKTAGQDLTHIFKDNSNFSYITANNSNTGQQIHITFNGALVDWTSNIMVPQEKLHVREILRSWWPIYSTTSTKLSPWYSEILHFNVSPLVF